MKLKTFVINRAYIFLTLLAFLLAIVEFQYDLVIEDFVIKYALIGIYYGVVLLGMYSFYKTSKPNKLMLFIFVLAGLSFSTNILLVLPYILIIPVVYRSLQSSTFKAFGYLLLFMMFIGIFIGGMVNNLSEIPIEESYVYDEELTCLVKFHERANNYSVYIEREYYDIFTLRERVFFIEDYEKISWLDKETIKIDHKTIKINE